MPRFIKWATETMTDLTEYGKVTGWKYLKGILTIATAAAAAYMDGASACGVSIAIMTCWSNLLDHGKNTNDGSVTVKSLDQ